MSDAPGDLIVCDHPGCENTRKSHRWGNPGNRWFSQKDGKSFCPEHIPDWVADWRARKR